MNCRQERDRSGFLRTIMHCYWLEHGVAAHGVVGVRDPSAGAADVLGPFFFDVVVSITFPAGMQVHIIFQNVVSSSAESDDWVWRFVFGCWKRKTMKLCCYLSTKFL